MDAILETLSSLPDGVVYVLLAAGAALENLLPPVPADTFVLLGGFLAGRGALLAWVVFLVTWGSNVTSAMVVYAVGRRHGRTFFEEGLGRKVLTPHQLRRMGRFYRRWGTPAIFLARFLPGLRAVVPAFAGVSGRGALAVGIPVVVASAIWYGALVWLGASTGRNLEAILALLDRTNRLLLGGAVVVVVGVGVWWYRSRGRENGG
jgi:undecaprenyl-diphosphatase